MPGFSMNFTQHQKQSLQLKLSPQMIQSLSFLAMNTQELCDFIYEETQRNPALEIVRDARRDMESVVRIDRNISDNVRTGEASAAGKEESDNFQSFLENVPQPQESLQEHLLFQFRLSVRNPEDIALGIKLIDNLDSRGFNREPPENLLDRLDSRETPERIRYCLDIIRQLDPPGCATSGPEESLLVQAQQIPDAPPLALYLLDGRLSLLERSRPATLLKKLQELAERETAGSGKDSSGTSGTGEARRAAADTASGTAGIPGSGKMAMTAEPVPPQPLTEVACSAAVDFIRSLEPLPGRRFSSSGTRFIAPDVRVTKIPDEENGGVRFQVELLRGMLPQVAVSPSFKSVLNSDSVLKSAGKEEKKFIKNAVRDAEWFIDVVQQREATLLKTARLLVDIQHTFFEKGPKFLIPLRMKDVAEKMNVHETTVSRIANGKYLQCEWGLFELKYFFSSKVEAKPAPVSGLEQPAGVRSKESVKLELKEMIQAYETEHPGAKPLSDQKLSDMLAARGIQVARRTVAKYRGELQIESSFDRKK